MKPEHDELLLTWAKAEDVHVVNVLRMGDTKKPTSNRTLVTGQEDPRNDISEQGHTIALNINAPVGDTAKYYLFDSMFDGAHAQDGLVGYAHMAWAPVWYRRDAPELMPTWDPNDYYDFLKFGEPADGIVGVGSVVGRNAGSEFSVTAWFAALKQGRTFVSNGPMLLLTAGKAMPGDEVEPVAGEAIQVWTRAKRRSTMRCGPRRGRKRRCWGR